MFSFVKDKIPTHPNSNVIYTIKYAGCGEDYVGKTDRCVITRLNEHSNRSYQPMFQHLPSFTAVQKHDEILIKIWIHLPYLGKKFEELVKTCMGKPKPCFKTNVKLVTLYDTSKCAVFSSVKDKILTLQKSNIIYTIKGRGCGEANVRKTDRWVIRRLNEHSNRSDQPIIQHLEHCNAVQKDEEIVLKIWIRLAYLINKGEKLVKACIRKLKCCFKANVKFVT